MEGPGQCPPVLWFEGRVLDLKAAAIQSQAVAGIGAKQSTIRFIMRSDKTRRVGGGPLDPFPAPPRPRGVLRMGGEADGHNPCGHISSLCDNSDEL